MTFDFDDGTAISAKEKLKNRKGRPEITFNNYVINKGIIDAVFK